VLIGDNLHTELIKRVSDVAAFLCNNGEFPRMIDFDIVVDMIDKIWESSENKHESINRAIYEFLEYLTGYLNL